MNEKQIYQNTLNWFKKDELATQVWLSKYALRNKKGELVESGPKKRYEAIAQDIIAVEVKFAEDNNDTLINNTTYMRHALLEGKITPAGSGLYGIGNPYSISSLSNCFVISGNGEDSYGSILKLDEELVQIAKRRGGIGFDISHLRPAGSLVQNSAKTSSGATSFMSRFSNSAREVAQDGRRGALMLTMHINHPDALKFAKSKRDLTQITGANISIKITDEFMRAVTNDEIHHFRYPVDAPEEIYILKSGDSSENFPESKYGSIKARELWNEIIKSNWLGAEPGLLFWDRIIEESPADCYSKFKTESTNPCSELPLSPYDSCRLLSINLVKFVLDPYTTEAEINWSDYRKHIRLAIRMMDNIVELEIWKLQDIIKKIIQDEESPETKSRELALWTNILRNTKLGRRLGASIIGHADLLASVGLKYDSEESLALVEQLHRVFRDEAYQESIQLAKERGVFPEYDYAKEVDNPFLDRLPAHIKDEMLVHGRRNIALLTIPPAGSLAIILGISSGIEPVFSPYYNRRRKINPEDGDRVDVVDEVGDSWQEYKVIHPGLQRWRDATGRFDSSSKIQNLNLASDEELDWLITKSPYAKCFTNDIDPLFKAKMQGTIQKFICHGISTTYNLKEDVTENEISDLYFEAWHKGTKGMTIYREGSRSGVLINKKKKKNEFTYTDSPKRPRSLPCDVYHPTIHSNRYVVLVGLYNGKPYEVMSAKSDDVSVSQSMDKGFLVKQRSTVYNLTNEEGNIIVEDIISKFEAPEWDALTRMTSTALRHGADINFVVEQLKKSNGSVSDVSKVIARTLKKYLLVQEITKGKACPQCGDPLILEGGCEQCINPECGYGRCD